MIKFRQKDFSIISRGVRFIKELRTIDPLPIDLEEYEKLLYGEVRKKPGNILSFEKIEIPEIENIKSKLRSFYHNQKADNIITRIGRSYSESCWPSRTNILPELAKESNNRSDKYWEAIKYSYNKLQKLPKRYITNSISNGAYGIVFEYPGNRIEKISFLGFTPNEYKFYNYIKGHPVSIFPKIYDLEEDQVIMEKLNTATPKISECGEYIKKYIIKEDTNKGFKYRYPNWELMEKDLGKNHWFYKFIEDIERELYKIFGFKTVGDLLVDNIGERRNGDLVYFDPIGGLLAMEGK